VNKGANTVIPPRHEDRGQFVELVMWNGGLQLREGIADNDRFKIVIQQLQAGSVFV